MKLSLLDISSCVQVVMDSAAAHSRFYCNRTELCSCDAVVMIVIVYFTATQYFVALRFDSSHILKPRSITAHA